MTDTTLTTSKAEAVPGLPPFRLGALFGLAVLTGVAAQAGLPGSIIALVPTGILLLICSPLDWPNRNRSFRLLLGLTIGVTLAIAIQPGPLNLGIGWLTFALLAYAAKGGSFSDLLQSLQSVLFQLLFSPAESAKAAATVGSAFRSRAMGGLKPQAAIVPVLAVLLFTLLFMVSNQSYFDAVTGIFDFRIEQEWWQTIIISLLVLQLLIAILAMTSMRLSPAMSLEAEAPSWHVGLFSPGSVIATLACLNGVFLLQNILDAQYLWSGMLGTPGNSYAEYAQKGAFTLIVTVILAAGLMILSLWPGSRTNASRAVRLLVYVWLLQNGMLLASCAARLHFYIDAYGLTLLRLASMVWMGLIGGGLVLVAIRIIRNRSNLWLVNANIVWVFAVLWASGFADFSRIVAAYNADRAVREDTIDRTYMEFLGPSALPALKELQEAREFWGLESSIATLKSRLRDQQSDWRLWTLRGALLSTELVRPLPPPPESGMVSPCPTRDTLASSSDPSRNSSGASLPGGDCPVPNSPPVPR
jgi:hypothetical protein